MLVSGSLRTDMRSTGFEFQGEVALESGVAYLTIPTDRPACQRRFLGKIPHTSFASRPELDCPRVRPACDPVLDSLVWQKDVNRRDDR